MKTEYTARFARAYSKLPAEIKQLMEKKEKIFREDPFHPGLKTHKLHGKLAGLYALSLNHKYRIIFELIGRETICCHAIGGHEIY